MQYIAIRKPPPSELYHFGVKGMKWGVVNNKKTKVSKLSVKLEKRETKARKFEQLASESKSPKQKQMYLKEAERARAGKLSRKQRQVLVGASIVAAYATYKVIDSGEAHRLITKGKAAIDGKPFEWKKNEAFGNKNLSADEVFDKVVSRINEDYGKPGTTNNCRRCTFAYVKARQGYDVVATKTFHGSGQTNLGLYNAVTPDAKIKGGAIGVFRAAYKDLNFRSFALQEGKNNINVKIDTKATGITTRLEKGQAVAGNIFSQLSKMPDNSCGELQMTWDVGGGHSMAWEIIKGKPVIFDTQTKSKYDSPELILEYASRMKTVSFSRLDNVNLDETIMGRWVKNAK